MAATIGSGSVGRRPCFKSKWLETADVTKEDDQLDSQSERVIERGYEYNHDEHGTVRVIGIWRGVNSADSAYNTDEAEVIIVRFAPENDKVEIQEDAETLNRFLEKTE